MISSIPRSTDSAIATAASRVVAEWCSSTRGDIEELGFHDGDIVDLVTHWEGDDHVRRAQAFRIVAYQTPRGSAAAYYPETNPLVPLDSTAVGSNTPTSKSVIIRLERSGIGQVDTGWRSSNRWVRMIITRAIPSRSTCILSSIPEQRSDEPLAF